jgi:hypothetical protein
MQRRPIWSVSAGGGLVCALFALSSLFHGTPEAGTVLAAGAILLFAWAAWLRHHEH